MAAYINIPSHYICDYCRKWSPKAVMCKGRRHCKVNGAKCDHAICYGCIETRNQERQRRRTMPIARALAINPKSNPIEKLKPPPQQTVLLSSNPHPHPHDTPVCLSGEGQEEEENEIREPGGREPTWSNRESTKQSNPVAVELGNETLQDHVRASTWLIDVYALNESTFAFVCFFMLFVFTLLFVISSLFSAIQQTKEWLLHHHRRRHHHHHRSGM